MSRISVKDAVKRYGNNTVIPDLNLEIGDGELFTLLGPSGCGKTTLLRMIAGFNSIEGGTLTNRPVMKDAATNDAMTPMADINVIEEDIPYVSAHKSELVDKYTEIFTDLQSK